MDIQWVGQWVGLDGQTPSSEEERARRHRTVGTFCCSHWTAPLYVEIILMSIQPD